MPYFDDSLNQKDDEDQQQATGAAPVKLADASSSGSTGVNVATPSGVQQPQQSQPANQELNTGSQYQNLDKYLATNQPQQFEQQLVGKVGGTINSAQQDQTKGANAFAQNVQNSNQTPTSDQVTSALANPTQANPTDFQNWMSQTYQGPKSLAEDQDAWKQYWSGTNQAATNTSLLGTEPGRFTLLDSYFGRPQYSFGEKSLDNLLVQNGGLGQDTRNLQNQAAQLQTQGQKNADDLSNVVAAKEGQLGDSSNSVTSAYNQAVTDSQNQIQNETTSAQAFRDAQDAALKQSVANGQLTQSQFNELGLDPGSSLYNLDLSNYMPTSPITNEQVATDDQRSRLEALAQLAGQQQTFLGLKQDYSPLDFNQSAFMNDLNNAKSQVAALQPLFTEDSISNALTNNGKYNLNDSFKLTGNVPGDMEILRNYANEAGPVTSSTPPDLVERTNAVNKILQAYDQFMALNPGNAIQLAQTPTPTYQVPFNYSSRQ